MALGDTYADDWKSWVERENITLRARTSLDPTYTDHALSATGGAAKRRAITNREIYRSNGVYTGKEQVFLIPNQNLPSGVVPKPGHLIVDADEVTHVVLEVTTGKYKQTHRCVSIIVNLESGLTLVGSVLRYPVTASNQRDDAGRPTYVNPTTVYTDIACRLQPADSQAELMLGKKVTPQDFVAVLGVTTIVIRPHDRFRVSDPADPEAGSTDYTIMGSSDQQRLDENARLYLRKLP